MQFLLLIVRLTGSQRKTQQYLLFSLLIEYKIRYSNLGEGSPMEQNVPHIANIQKYHDRFREVAEHIKYEPKRDRTCNDKICYVVFFIVLAVFLATGIFYMKTTDIRNIIKAALKSEEYKDYAQAAEMAKGFRFQNLKPAIPIMAGMMSLTVIMAAMLLCLLTRFPKCIFFMMFGLGAVIIAGITFLLFYYQQFVPAIVMCVIGAILIIIVLCSLKRFLTGIALLNIASRFLFEKPSTFIAPVVVLFFLVAFEVFWSFGLAGIQIYTGDAKTSNELDTQKSINYLVSFCWAFFKMYFSCFFYYSNSFLIATAAGIWYYNQEQNYIARAVSRIFRYHLGSFTFAALIVGIVSITRKYTERQANQGIGMATFCICCLGCCLKYMEDLLETLNHHAIIVMSVTGESYFDSARTTLSLIYPNFPLYFLVDIMNHVVTITGIIFVCGLPGLISFFLLRGTAENPDDLLTQVVGTVIIVLFGALIGAIFLSVLTQALSCMFIFYCLDSRFSDYGYPAPERAPRHIKQIFGEISPYVGGEYNEHYDKKSSQMPANDAPQPPSHSEVRQHNQNPYRSQPEPDINVRKSPEFY